MPHLLTCFGSLIEIHGTYLINDQSPNVVSSQTDRTPDYSNRLRGRGLIKLSLTSLPTPPGFSDSRTDMIVMDCRLVVDGVLEYVPPFAYVQSKFEPIHILEWLRNYKFVSVFASAVYVILLFEAFQCRNQSLWRLIKIIEFGDTLFVVLRKKPLQFIHWYHHITVCIYSFYPIAGASGTFTRWLYM